jgi:hypothetical protein
VTQATTVTPATSNIKDDSNIMTAHNSRNASNSKSESSRKETHNNKDARNSRDYTVLRPSSYIAPKSVNLHSGPDSKVMHSFTTRMRFSQSSVMMMDTSPVHRIWHVKARYARFLTLPAARVIHIPPAQHTGL